MNKMTKKEYNAPKTTCFSMHELSVMCASEGATSAVSIQSFEEDDELIW